MIQVDHYEFNSKDIEKVKGLEHWGVDVGNNWPVVYVINNDTEAYIGETTSAYQRFGQHMQNKERQKLTEIRIVSDKTFNKSVVLDLEAFLIKHMASDGKYRLQNGNNGLHNHEYYNKTLYEEEFRKVWEKLRTHGVVQSTLDEIENSELYKYSPYKSLGQEQMEAEREIVSILTECSKQPGGTAVVVRGGAGTGKTILAIYLMKLFSDIAEKADSEPQPDDEYVEEDILTPDVIKALSGIRKIGLVIPQKSLQKSLKEVFGSIRGLDPKMVLSPLEVVNEYDKTGKPFDMLLVDEAHRLKCRNKGHLTNYRSFDRCNQILGLDKKFGNELDWLIRCSRNQILFRDELQTVRPCDIEGEIFEKRLNDKYGMDEVRYIPLSTQWRCEGGSNYVEYMKGVLSCRAAEPREITGYDLRLYHDCAQMVSDIKDKEKEMGLCRVVAGYAWKWDKKNLDNKTIEIQGKKYLWNRTYLNWIGTKTSIDEIGCIHTVQGYDLNYVGVIIGEDIKYDPEEKKIYADKDCYFDQQGKSGVADDPEALCQYLCNIYLTLLTRGIKGTYIYVCNDELREYFEQYIPVK